MNNELNPAFPFGTLSGMTLRDWFAFQVDVSYFVQNRGNNNPERIAKYRYECADAMMKEREKYRYEDTL